MAGRPIRHQLTGGHHDQRHQHAHHLPDFPHPRRTTYQGSGFFTALYQIAPIFLSPDNMMLSMRELWAA